MQHASDGGDALYFFRLALFREDMQCEAFAEMSQTLGFDAGLLPPLGALASRAALLFPALRWVLGSEAAGFAFDNERGRHEHAVPEFEFEFEIDAQPNAGKLAVARSRQKHLIRCLDWATFQGE